MQGVQEAIKQIEIGWKSQKIRLVGAALNKSEMDLLRESLSTHHTVKSLEICLCEVTEAELLELVKQMPGFALVGLQMVHLNIGPNVAKALAGMVQEVTLKKLDLAFNKVDADSAKALSVALLDCGLESLLLGRNNIGEEGAKYFADAIGTGTCSLRTLDLSRNKIGDVGLVALARALPKSKLDTLLVDTNLITHEGVETLCMALHESPSMLNLSIGGNRLNDETVTLIANTLKFTNLERLSLNANDFGDVSLRVLAEAARDSTTLELLDLKQNAGITDDGVRHLMQCLKTHRTMKTVILDDTGTSARVRLEMQQLLARLHDEHANTLMAMCSVRLTPRVGVYSTLSVLPIELMRNLSRMLGRVKPTPGGSVWL